MDVADASPDPPRPRGAARRGLAWALAIIVAVGIVGVIGGVLIAQALGERLPPHPVLYARFATDNSLPTAAGTPHVYQLWTDPTLSSARLRMVGNGDTIYYVRSSAGVWSVVGRATPRAPWQRTRLLAGQEPSLLTEQGVRALFARLKKNAGAALVSPVDLRNHVAFAFPAAGVTWPYRYVGTTRIWIDAATGLPLQYRNVVIGGKEPVTILTVVDELRTVSSTRLPADFFTPPDRRLSAWEQLVHGVAAWLQTRLGRV